MSFSRAAILLFALPFVVPATSSEAQEPQQPQYRVQPIFLPALSRPSIDVSRAALPAGTAGRLPTYDGETFALNFTDRLVAQPAEAQVRAVVDSVLRAVQWTGDAADLQLVTTTQLPGADDDITDGRVQQAQSDDARRLQGRHGRVAGGVADSMQAESQRMGEESKQASRVFRYDQVEQGVVIDNSGLAVAWREGRGLVSVTGRVFSDVTMDNSLRLDAAQAQQAAETHVGQTTTVNPTPPAQPVQVILPYNSGMRFAWKMDVMAEEGPYRLWVDADDGSILQLEPLFHSAQDSGSGLAFDPDPSTGTRVWNFEVNVPSGGQYILRLAGVLDVENNGADGMCNGDLTINDAGTGQANFNVAPINGTVVNRVSQTNYNCRAQDVNVFGWMSWLLQLWEGFGSQTFPAVITAQVNDDDPCGFGANNGCASGTGSLILGIGLATTGNSTSCSDLFNPGVDATFVTHEAGHLLNNLQFGVGGGTLPGYLHEGLADYWSHATHGINTFAAFAGGNCAVPSQDSWFPRQAEAGDVFPARLATATFNHGWGQMIAWALWDTRREMAEATTLGAVAFNTNLLTAMTTAGIGVQTGNQPQRIYTSYLDLLTQLGNQYSTSRNMHKLLSGFARAGLFLTPADAVIDIDDDFLDSNAANGPTFTVWTGRDFGFNANQTVNNAVQPCNTQFTVEVASDAAFTQNLVSSGAQNAGNTGVGCFGNWTLAAADWTTLSAEDQLFYRATTTNAAGGNQRVTGSPGAATFVNVPPGKAEINTSGEEECCVSAGAATMMLFPVFLGMLWRRRLKHDAD